MAKKLTQDSFADSKRSLISSDKTRDPGINLYLDSIGTTHVSVLAEDGSAVSVTSSINDESVPASFCFTARNQLSDIFLS